MQEKDMIRLGKIGIMLGFVLLIIALQKGYYTGLEEHEGKVISISKQGPFYQYTIEEKNIIVCNGFKTRIRQNQTITYETTPGKCFIWSYR